MLYPTTECDTCDGSEGNPVVQRRPSDQTELVCVLVQCSSCAPDFANSVEEVEEKVKAGGPFAADAASLVEFFDRDLAGKYGLAFLTI